MKPLSSSHRLGYVLLALVSLGLAWVWMAGISARDPWYRNTDMNIHNLADALSLNSGYGPGIVDQPGAPTKFLLALDYRIRNAAGTLQTWTLKRFARSAEPLREIAQLVRVGRWHSRMIVIVFIIGSAAYVGLVTKRLDLACFTTALMCGSSGLLFHGLLVRPELLCAGFGGVLAPIAVWQATAHARPTGRALWLLCAGICLGLALLSKLPAVIYLALAVGWCGIAPLLHTTRDEKTTDMASASWTIALCLGAGIAALVLSLQVSPLENMLDPVGTARLRLMAATVALLPLVLLTNPTTRLSCYLVGRTLDFSLLGAGVLVAFVGWFALLRTVLPADACATYMAKILNTAIYPDPLLKLFTVPGESHRIREALRFFAETPVLFIATAVLGTLAVFMRTAPLRLRVLMLFLLFQASGFVFLMSKRLFLEQYSVFVQVPLLMIWALALGAWDQWWKARGQTAFPRWPVALATSAALLMVVSVPVALNPKYNHFQSDDALPVRDLTITFLYDHDAHPPAYIAAMKRRYPTREEFADALQKFLHDPENRY